ncbi:hypothetical protein FACS1894217_08600 [Clostridia bacterium]|nr:hypothetical protein FACS1894217_08600 [Clostridia bacterium]
MLKRIAAMFIALGFVLTPVAAVAAGESPSVWAADAVKVGLARGIVIKEFAADYQAKTDRALFCRALVNFIEVYRGQSMDDFLTERELTRVTFDDTSDPDIAALAALGIVEGTGGNLFSPEKLFSRAHAATMMGRLLKVLGEDTAKTPVAGFADMDTVADWAQDGVSVCAARQIMNGTGGNLFSPNKYYINEECVQTLNNMYDYLAARKVIPPIRGIDVSHWQGEIDWAKVYGDGIRFVMIKLGGNEGKTGTPYTDRNFTANITGALAAGLNVGVYFYSGDATAEAATKSAAYIIEKLAPYKGKLKYPIAFDLEEPHHYTLPKAALTAVAAAFCEQIKSAGYTPALYANTSILRNLDMDLFPYDLWLAQWSDTRKEPSVECAMWQWSDHGRVAGIKGNVDLDYSYKDYAKL